jgi:ACS family hexuronate transporter-like MFS transporter
MRLRVRPRGKRSTMMVENEFKPRSKAGIASIASENYHQSDVAERRIQWRWLALGILVIASALNYFDRQLMAAVAPTLKAEFHLSNIQYGEIVSVFSITYALITPLAGMFVDRVGLNVGVTTAIIVWSLASSATGLTHTLSALVACRMMLGMGEAAGIPASSKSTATYLKPREFSLGNSLHLIGISLGSITAPLVAAAMAPRYGWRSVFLVSGVAGILWVPLWRLSSKLIPAQVSAGRSHETPVRAILCDRRLWGLMAANSLVMTVYTLWINWTTIYFVQAHHLIQAEANRQFAWIPPLFATLGGLFGGFMAYRWSGEGTHALSARMRVCRLAAPFLLITAAIPFMPSTSLATAAICLSFFVSVTISNNIGVIPIDLFGPERAAFTASALTCSFALMQTFVSPAIGGMVDRFGFSSVCIAFSVLPLVGVWILRNSIRGADITGQTKLN